MKSRTWILIFVAILFLLFWTLWPRPNQRVAEEAPPAVSTTPVAPVPQSVATDNPSLGEVLRQRNPEKLKEAKEQEAKSIEAFNRNIDFYGKTVDQDGNPLPGVQIKMTVPHYVAFSLDGKMLHVDRTSDAYGLFEIHDANITGDGIDLDEMSKEGYTLEPCHRGLGPIDGTPGNPVIFKLWRNDIKEPLIAGRDALDLLADGRLYVISITNALIREENQGTGDMTVWVKRPDGVTWSNRFTWSCGLQMVNGGISEELDGSSAMYVAPTDAYSNDFHFDATNGWGKTTGVRRFYLRLSNGNYGRASIEILSYFDHQIPGLIRIQYAINPTGSRILR